MVLWNTLGATDIFTAGASSRAVEIKNNMDNAADNFDFMLICAYFGLHLGILALAYLLRTHPVIYVAAILLTAVLALVAAPISNAYGDITAETDLSSAAADLPKTNHILNNLVLYEIVWAFATIIIMFGMAKNEGII